MIKNLKWQNKSTAKKPNLPSIHISVHKQTLTESPSMCSRLILLSIYCQSVSKNNFWWHPHQVALMTPCLAHHGLRLPFLLWPSSTSAQAPHFTQGHTDILSQTELTDGPPTTHICCLALFSCKFAKAWRRQKNPPAFFPDRHCSFSPDAPPQGRKYCFGFCNHPSEWSIHSGTVAWCSGPWQCSLYNLG